MEEDRRPTTVRLRVGTLEWLKVEALRRRTSVTDLVEEIVLDEKQRTEDRS